MRILLVSDLHYTLKQLDWVTSVASRVRPRRRRRRSARHRVTRRPRRADRGRARVPRAHGGADDGHRVLGQPRPQRPQRPRRARGPVARRGTGAGVIVDGTSLSRDDAARDRVPVVGRTALTVREVDRQLADDAALVGDRRWIWVYHAPPDSSPTSWTGRRHYGDEDLDTWIERYQPAVVLCGHVHESPFATGGSWIDRIGCDGRVQRRPPARTGAHVHRARHRDRTGVLVVARGRRSGILRRRRLVVGLVLGVGIALGPELAARARAYA